MLIVYRIKCIFDKYKLQNISIIFVVQQIIHLSKQTLRNSTVFWIFHIQTPANNRIRHAQKQREREIVDLQDNPLNFTEVIF